MRSFFLKLFFLFIALGAPAALYAQSISGSASVGAGTSQTYSYNSGAVYTNANWTATNGAGITSQTSAGTNYTATIVFQNGGTSTVNFQNGSVVVASLTVSVACPLVAKPNPTFTYTNNCGNTVITRNSNPPGTAIWWWQTGSTDMSTSLGNSTTYTVNTAGTYYLRAQSSTASGCWSSTSQATSAVTVKAIPDVAAPSQSICSGTATSISITNPNNTSGTTFSWTTAVSGSITGYSNSSGSTIAQTLTNSSNSANGTVTYTITPTASGCAGTAIQAVATVKALPAITSTLQQETCSGTVLTYAPTASFSGSTFAWTSTATSGISGNSSSGTGSISNTLTNANTTAGTATYTITATNSGCAGTPSNFVATVVPIPVISPTTPAPLVVYGASSPLSTTATFNQYQWKLNGSALSGATQQNYNSAAVGSYTVGIKNTSTSTLECVSTPVSLSAQLAIQAAAVNYQSTTVITKAGQTAGSSLYALNPNDLVQVISYQDGLGRPFQTVAVGQSGTLTDLVSPVAYGNQALVDTTFLGYATTSRDGRFRYNAIRNSSGVYTGSEQQQFYQNASKVAHDNQPFARTIYATSPDARVMEQGAPGADWQPGSHTVKNVMTLNTGTYPVRYWKYDGSTNGNYPAKTVGVAITTDENNNQVTTYTNKQGQAVLKQVQVDTTINGTQVHLLETYYIYDQYGRLTYQVPPKAMAVIGTTVSYSVANNTATDSYVYKYMYDSLGRVVEKIAPGAAVEYTIYDQLGRVALTQDGNLRASNQWMFTKYDSLNRPVYSGLYTNTTLTTRKALQNYYINSINYNTQPYAEYPSNNATYQGYSNNVFPTANLQLLAVNYYDNYDFDHNGTADYNYDNTHYAGLPNAASTQTRGLATGSKKLIIGSSNWLVNVVFYDNLDRPLQTQSNNHLNLASLQDKASVLYVANDLSTHVQKTYATHTGASTVTVLQRYGYDNAWRTTAIYHTINGGTEQQLAAYEYNAIGQLVDKKLHVSGSSFMQSIDMRYHIRGWLSSINNAQLANDANVTNDDTNDYFGMELFYNTQESSGLGNKKQFNGNISALKWKNPGASSGTSDQRSYKYYYDHSDKLISAQFQANTGSAWTKEANTLNEAMGYDHHGNILSLTRSQNQRGLSGTTVTSAQQTIDNLTYTYTTGNQLSSVLDGATTTGGFADGANNATEYTYDVTGSLTKDDNKGISAITYNVLGKAQQITYTSGTTIVYTYDASGTKLKTATTVSGTTTTTDYVNSFVYSNNALSFFSSPEGRVVKNGSSYEYQYAIADHQGNTRVLFTSATPTATSTLADFDGDANDLSSQFSSVPTPITYSAANHTPSGSKVIRLNQTVPIGPGLSKKVFAGDKVNMEVWSYYEAGSGYGTSNTGTATLISSIATALIANTGGTDAGGLKSSGVNSALTGFGLGANQGDAAPAAFLNYILFDLNYKVMDAGWKVITTGTFTQKIDSISNIKVKAAGYIFVYLSYEDQSNNWVYFDDFKVTVTPTNIIQSNEYYPFGLQTANSWTRDNATANNFLANGGTELNTTSSLYDLEFRNYDPILGRMNGVDPMAHKYSSLTPYNYSFNSPATINDPSGADPDLYEMNRIFAIYRSYNPTIMDNPYFGQMTMALRPSEYAFASGMMGTNPNFYGPKYDVDSRQRGLAEQNSKGEWGYWFNRNYIGWGYSIDEEGNLVRTGTVNVTSKFVVASSLSMARTMMNPLVQYMHKRQNDFVNDPAGGFLMAFLSGAPAMGLGNAIRGVASLARAGAPYLLRGGQAAWNLSKSYASTLSWRSFGKGFGLSVVSQGIIQKDYRKIDWIDAALGGLGGNRWGQVVAGGLGGFYDFTIEDKFVSAGDVNKSGFKLGVDVGTGVVSGFIGMGINAQGLNLNGAWQSTGDFLNNLFTDGMSETLAPDKR